MMLKGPEAADHGTSANDAISTVVASIEVTTRNEPNFRDPICEREWRRRGQRVKCGSAIMKKETLRQGPCHYCHLLT